MSLQNERHRLPRTSSSRLTSVDALRGFVMVIMALDHTRDFFHVGAMSFSPEDLTRTTPILFLTRWITHICAPTFVFLAGAGAFLRLQRDGSKARVSHFLSTRGVWLIFIELTVMRAGDELHLDSRYPFLLIILTALGVSMIALAVLIHLPTRALAVVSVAIVLLHNTLDGINAAQFGAFAARLEPSSTSRVLHARGRSGRLRLPGAAVDRRDGRRVLLRSGALGLEPDRRRRVLAATGAAFVALFLIVEARECLWRPGAVVASTLSGLHAAVVSQNDEISAVAGIPADDARPVAAPAGALRRTSTRPREIRW